MREYLKLKANTVEKVMRDYLGELKYPKNLVQGMEYSVFNGGKRLRPILVLMSLELLDMDENLGYSSAVAIELIHSYSLVHDDLPALDNDDYRRGKLTCHKKYGEASAILIGDALLTYAFKILASKNSCLEAEKVLEIISKIAGAAGVNGMIGGQAVDLESEGKEIDLPTLQYIHTHKTGMLLRVPVEIAGIIAGVDEEKQRVLTEFADLLGLAFQIKDDILDIEGDFEKLGKTIGSDIKLEKSTYPSIFGLEKSKEILKEKMDKAKEILKKNFGGKSEKLVKLVDFIGERES